MHGAIKMTERTFFRARNPSTYLGTYLVVDEIGALSEVDGYCTYIVHTL